MTPENLDVLFASHQNKGILIDTNLLLLYLVGLTNPARVATFKPIQNQGFTMQDFELLKRIVLKFRKLATTPHILTEVSNHSDKLKDDDKNKFCALIRVLLEGWEEHHPKSAELVKRIHFVKLGLTDTAISEVAPGGYLVLTIDFELTGHLKNKGVSVINFNTLRL